MVQNMAVERIVFALLVFSMLNRSLGVPLNRDARESTNNEVGYENDEKTSAASAATFTPKELGKSKRSETVEPTVWATTKTTTAMKLNRKPLESIPFKDNDDDGLDSDFDDMQFASSNSGGSNLISLFNLSGSLLPGLSGGTTIQNAIKYIIGDYMRKKPMPILSRRNVAGSENEIAHDINLVSSFGELDEGKRDSNSVSKESSSRTLGSNEDQGDRLTPDKEKEGSNSLIKESSFKRLESNGEKTADNIGLSKGVEFQNLELDNEKKSNQFEESDESSSNAAKESLESEEGESNSKQAQSESDSRTASESEESSESDSDEPPGGGDGEGGGVLGFLAQFSGGEDGQSDLGSLLGAISGVIVNLSGDGVDVNNIIASGLGLLVGLLSEGDENPGSVLASYLLTSLDTLTGGGANNNGAFFGNFISKLVKGTSAGGDTSDSDEDTGMDAGSDPFGFFTSLIMGLLGSMSKGSHSS